MKVIITESFGVGLCNDVEGSSRPQGRPKARSKGLKEAESLLTPFANWELLLLMKAEHNITNNALSLKSMKR